MITTNRRRQFGGVDDRIKIIHPQWWHIKFKAIGSNTIIQANENTFNIKIKEIVSAPAGSNVTGGLTLKVDKAGEYELFITVSANANAAMYYGTNTITYLRLPTPYSNDGYIRPLFGYKVVNGNSQWQMINVYLLRNYPPSGPNNSALQSSVVSTMTIHIPKGSLQNYLNNANTSWTTLYNAGRLIEVDYKIIED